MQYHYATVLEREVLDPKQPSRTGTIISFVLLNRHISHTVSSAFCKGLKELLTAMLDTMRGFLDHWDNPQVQILSFSSNVHIILFTQTW